MDRVPVTVTLVTGDRVTLTVDGFTIAPGPGRSGMRFLTSRTEGELAVVPADALPLIGAGRLDRRLFEVTALAREGYHDAARADLPLIVTYEQGTARRATNSVVAAGARTVRELSVVDSAAVSVDKGRLSAFWSTLAGSGAARLAGAGVARVWLDGKRRLSLDHSVSQVGAPVAHAAGLTGRGVRVAVLDSGIDATHPDLRGRVAAARNFTEDADPSDVVGHGTHVASIIAGSGSASGGRYRGVAPEATLLDGKVCESVFCTESAILAGMEWAVGKQRARVVNLSLSGFDRPGLDPLEEAVNTLTARTGALFVIAAGNFGAERTVGSPGSADAALTVGAVDRDDLLADFSSRGPRVGDDAVKPEITAPGVGIVAARAAGTQLGEPVGKRYVGASGTSMATPHVAGAAALLAQSNPDWTADQLKPALVASARPHSGLTAYEQGSGRLDVARAIEQTVSTEQSSLSFGRTLWPHGDDRPVARMVTYRNHRPEEVELELSLSAAGPAGASPPAGMFGLDRPTVTVPAGGTAQVRVTVDTSVRSAEGYWTGHLLATDGTARVVTPLAVHKEPESYQLTITHIDRTGETAEHFYTALIGLDNDQFESFFDQPGQVRVRLPRGRYGLSSWLWSAPRDDPEELPEVTTLARPALRLDRDTTLILDGRRGRPVRVDIPDRSAQLAFVDLSHGFRLPGGGMATFSTWTGGFDGLYVANVGPAVRSTDFTARVAAQWARRDADGGFAGSPYLYAVSDLIPGRLPTGYQRTYRDRDLATVRNEIAGGGAGADRASSLVTAADRFPLPRVGAMLPVDVPGQRITYLGGDGTRWQSRLVFEVEDDEGWAFPRAALESTLTRYRAGGRHHEVWNAAPLGPGFPDPEWSEFWVSRQGDHLMAFVPLFSDGAGHAGFSMTDKGRTALYRDGVLVAELEEAGFGYFPVPRGRAEYRLETSAVREFSELSTRVEAAWTFRSGHVSGPEPARLPVAAIRFAPELELDNSAPSGASIEIPVTVRHQPGITGLTVRELAVEISYDDGATWRTAEVRATGAAWAASVQHSGGARFVSLRATATDSGGNMVTQTIIRAYRLR
jgi:hypothetical protein